jgi:Tfp pilus assembly protein PilO
MNMPRQRKYLIILGFVLLLLGALYRFYPDLSALLGGPIELDIKAGQVTRYRQVAAERQRLQSRHTALKGQLERAKQNLLTASTPSLAAVDIQNFISEIVFSNGLVLESVRVQRPKDSPVEGFLEVPVTVTLKLRIRQLVDLLHRIESAPHWLTVTDMNLRIQQSPDQDSLNAVITVAGYMLKPEGEADAASRSGAQTPTRSAEKGRSS